MLRKHSVSIRGHRTSFSLEDEFWMEFKEIAKSRGYSASRLITELDEARSPDQNLSSMIRVFVLGKVKSAVQEQSEQSS